MVFESDANKHQYKYLWKQAARAQAKQRCARHASFQKQEHKKTYGRAYITRQTAYNELLLGHRSAQNDKHSTSNKMSLRATLRAWMGQRKAPSEGIASTYARLLRTIQSFYAAAECT